MPQSQTVALPRPQEEEETDKSKLGLRVKIINIIKSMYSSVKSGVKFNNNHSNSFCCSLGVRQGEYLSPLLFSLFLNALEEQFILSGVKGLDVDMFKIFKFLLLYCTEIY